MAKKRNSVLHEPVIDTRSGSMAYNRLDMQTSQALHMAIELYPNMDNFLLVLDHYDDITLFESDTAPNSVSFYQMKSCEDSISIDTAISENWITKLYSHLNNTDWLTQELGLVTNCPLRVSFTSIGEDNKKHKKEQAYSSDRTPFNSFNPIVIDKVKESIASKNNTTKENVDLSKFYHMRTTLSIPKHREIVEQEMSEFLSKQHPRITVDVARAIYCAMMDLLTKRQSCELLDYNSPFNLVRERKGLSKNDFIRIIDDAMLISIPQFCYIQKIMMYKKSDEGKAALQYTTMLADFQNKSDSFIYVFRKIHEVYHNNPLPIGETAKSYCKRIFDTYFNNSLIYDYFYISNLIACMIINEEKRER